MEKGKKVETAEFGPDLISVFKFQQTSFILEPNSTGRVEVKRLKLYIWMRQQTDGRTD